MAWFLFFMRSAGVISRYINGAFCVNVTHISRMNMATVFSIISFLGIAISSVHTNNINYFYVALIASIFMGIA